MALAQTDIVIPGRGATLKGFLAYPEGADTLPGMLVLPGAGGLTDQIRGVATRLAEQGYSALAYDVYSRQPDAPVGSSYAEIVPYFNKIHDRTLLIDLDATLQFFRGLSVVDPDRIGVLGFCAAFSIVLASHDVRLKACVSFYNQIYYRQGDNPGPIISPINRIPNLWCPFQGHYGEADMAHTEEQRTELESALKRFNRNYEFYRYPDTPHAFMDEGTAGYEEARANLAWSRTFAFLGKHLAANA